MPARKSSSPTSNPVPWTTWRTSPSTDAPPKSSRGSFLDPKSQIPNLESLLILQRPHRPLQELPILRELRNRQHREVQGPCRVLVRPFGNKHREVPLHHVRVHHLTRR